MVKTVIKKESKIKLSPKGKKLYEDIEDAFGLIDKVYDLGYMEDWAGKGSSPYIRICDGDEEFKIESFIHYIWEHLVLFEDESNEKPYMDFEYILEEISWLNEEKLLKIFEDYSEYFTIV